MFNILYPWSAPSWIFIMLMVETAERNDSPAWPNSLRFMPSVDPPPSSIVPVKIEMGSDEVGFNVFILYTRVCFMCTTFKI